MRGHVLADGRFIPELGTRLYTLQEAQRYTPVGFCQNCLQAFAPGTDGSCQVCGVVVFEIIEAPVDRLGDCVTRRQLLLNGQPIPVKPAPDPGPVRYPHEKFTVIPARKDMLGDVLKLQQERNPHAGDHSKTTP